MTLTEETAEAQPRPAYPSRSARAWRIAALVAVLVAVAAHVWVAASALHKGFPTFSYDEIDTLLVGRAALGIPSPQVAGAGYFPLSSILVSPAWWITSNPFVFYRVAIAVGVLIALLTIWPLARVATRFGLTTPQAVTVAAIVMTLPARTVQADYALAEKALFLFMALSVLAAARLQERPTPLRAVIFSAAVALTYFSHARMLVFAVAAALWLVLFALRRWQAALVGLAALLPLTWGVGRLARHINSLVDPAPFKQGADLLDNLTVGNAGMLAREGLGQAWEQLVSGFGLATVGLVVAVALAWRELRGRSAGPASLILLSAGGLITSSVIAWASPDQLYATTWRRLDAWLYGRYADPAFELLTLLALCAVVRGLHRVSVVAAWCLALVIAIPTLFWVAPEAPTGAFRTPAHIPGAMAWSWALPTTAVPGTIPTLTNDNRFWLIATLTALLPLVVLAISRSRAGRAVVLGLVLALGAAGTVFANQASDEYQGDHQIVNPLGRELRKILADHPDATVTYDGRCPKRVARPGGRGNRFVWQLLPTVVSRTGRDADIVIACPAAGDSMPQGSLRLGTSAGGDLYAWVVPGTLQDDLVRQGLLEPVS